MQMFNPDVPTGQGRFPNTKRPLPDMSSAGLLRISVRETEITKCELSAGDAKRIERPRKVRMEPFV